MQGLRGIGGATTGSVTSRRGAGARDRFALPGNEEVGSAADAAPTAATTGIGALLLLQEAGDRGARDAAAERQADAMLNELTMLQRALLTGEDATGNLRRLAALGGSTAAHPVLREVADAVALRAAIELARRERRPPG